MTDVFLSYAREDLAQAKFLAGVLESRAWTVWWDREIHTGERFDRVIEAALDTAGCVIVVWSVASVASSWVRDEASDGLQRNVLLPVRIDAAKIPLEFRRLQTSDLTDWHGQVQHAGFEQLCRDLERIVGRKAAHDSPAGVSVTVPSQDEITSPRPNWRLTFQQSLSRPLQIRWLRWAVYGVLAGMLSLSLYAFNPMALLRQTVIMPDVNGLTLQQARAVLGAVGLSGNAASGSDLLDPNVVVVESSIKPGTIVGRGDAVVLHPLKRTPEDTAKERDHFDYIAAFDKRRLRWRKTGDGKWAEAITSDSRFPPIAFQRTGRTEVDGNVGAIVRAGDRELDVFIPDIGSNGSQPDWLRQRHGATGWKWVLLGQIVDPR